jgi:hypothetical protein
MYTSQGRGLSDIHLLPCNLTWLYKRKTSFSTHSNGSGDSNSSFSSTTYAEQKLVQRKQQLVQRHKLLCVEQQLVQQHNPLCVEQQPHQQHQHEHLTYLRRAIVLASAQQHDMSS